MVASLVVAASTQADVEASIKDGVSYITGASNTWSLIVTANVKWESDPLTFGACVIGQLGAPLLGILEKRAPGYTARDSALKQWLEEQRKIGTACNGSIVVFANWSESQLSLAFEVATERLQQLITLALLLEDRTDRSGLHFLRGEANRPGPRGLVLDRGALRDLLAQVSAVNELAATPIAISERDTNVAVHWYSADPFPLSDLFQSTALQGTVRRCMTSGSIVARRVATAARWYSKAHWSVDRVDAALALGVALDALVGTKSGLPGRAMADRIAMLECDKTFREKRAADYLEFYQVRSAVAHGGVSAKLQSAFLNEMARNVKWTAHRLLELEGQFAPNDERELNQVFDALRWGIKEWA